MALVLPETRVRRIIDGLLQSEGGSTFTDDPTDPGGATRWGITERVARKHGYTGPMAQLPESTARGIYQANYIHGPQFDAVMTIDPNIGAELIDTGVNMGQATAARFLQRWLNAFNVASDDGHTHYPDLETDGVVGKATLDALRAFLRWRGPMGTTAMLRGLNGTQAERYLADTEHNPSQRKYAFGWIVNRVEM